MYVCMYAYVYVYQDPNTDTLWVAKALPRVWLEEGQRVAVHNATTAYGRVSFVCTSGVESSNSIRQVLCLGFVPSRRVCHPLRQVLCLGLGFT